jgi:ubiquinone/menaquinone biosynthesis C-methylase UbiE
MPRRADAPDLSTWEQAEIARSERDAAALSGTNPRVSRASVQRYQAPPADTAYPLEYAHYLVGDVRGQTVLDLGCGCGINAVCLAERGARVWALDISESLARIARQRFAAHDLLGRASVLVASAHAIPLPAQSIDVVFGNAVLHHLDLSCAVLELDRVLRPGGRAVFREPVENSRVLRQIRRMIPMHWERVSPFERPLTSQALTALASRMGPHHSRLFSLPHVRLSRRLPLVRDHEDMLYRFDRMLLRQVPVLRPFATIEVLSVTKR